MEPNRTHLWFVTLVFSDLTASKKPGSVTRKDWWSHLAQMGRYHVACHSSCYPNEQSGLQPKRSNCLDGHLQRICPRVRIGLHGCRSWWSSLRVCGSCGDLATSAPRSKFFRPGEATCSATHLMGALHRRWWPLDTVSYPRWTIPFKMTTCQHSHPGYFTPMKPWPL